MTLASMSRYIACLAAIGGIPLSTRGSAALAEDQETWRCDTPNGHFDQYAIPISDRSTVITGRINVHKADFGADWASLAKVNIAQGGVGDCHCSGFKAVAQAHPEGVNFRMNAKDIDEDISTRFLNTPITFKISLDQQGVMTIQIGKDKPYVKSRKLVFTEHNYLMLSCSGVDVSFLNIDVH